jgi:hypothetical protein
MFDRRGGLHSLFWGREGTDTLGNHIFQVF